MWRILMEELQELERERIKKKRKIIIIRLLAFLNLYDFTRKSFVRSDRNSVTVFDIQKTRHMRQEEPKGGSTLCLDHQACLSCRVEMVIEVVCFPTEIL